MGSLLLKLIIGQLEQYIRSVSTSNGSGGTDDVVVLGNIATAQIAGGDNSKLTDKIVVSLVNIAEESSLKNNTANLQKNQQHFQVSPTVHVNLYLLFTANFEEYDKAINHMFRVLEFFQGRKVFQYKNAPFLIGGNVSAFDEEQMKEIELTVELHTLSFEQLNDLWGSLGGKQIPFVLYRARLVPVQMQQILGREGFISEIDLAIVP
ncbi:MAG TPA: DUF4255 domain-containing protein [Haliscomenobacter sp.]|uniref:DUF4255 domain-containing protein n=1 Tax=Haliscomenobacter sp. TaxID=2717303 RepID=UPI002CD357C0|nr:DUF4255 domain-containing protein [Haliscomenobacter sp.]HOY16513.1 DUF4255 domain-containing protein [Haliscomenobacter sp.]